MRKIFHGTLKQIEDNLNDIKEEIKVKYQKLGANEFIATVTILEDTVAVEPEQGEDSCCGSCQTFNLDEASEDNDDYFSMRENEQPGDPRSNFEMAQEDKDIDGLLKMLDSMGPGGNNLSDDPGLKGVLDMLGKPSGPLQIPDELSEELLQAIATGDDDKAEDILAKEFIKSEDFKTGKKMLQHAKEKLAEQGIDISNDLRKNAEMFNIPKPIIEALLDESDEIEEKANGNDSKANVVKEEIISHLENDGEEDAREMVMSYYEKSANLSSPKEFRELKSSEEHRIIMEAAEELGYHPDYTFSPEEAERYGVIMYPNDEQIKLIEEEREEKEIDKDVNSFFDGFDR